MAVRGRISAGRGGQDDTTKARSEFGSFSSSRLFAKQVKSLPAATPARLAIFAVGAPSPTLAISRIAAWRIALRFSELLTRAIPMDESTVFRPWE